jgi:predicted outer membrane protein
MNPSTNEILNRLLILHERSLPVYLSYAHPEHIEKSPRIGQVFRQMAEDHLRTVDRLGTLVLENHGTVTHGEFPMSFTSLHDLSADYLLKQMIERQEKVISAIEKLADMLATSPYAQAAAREALGEAKGHLENLQEVAAAPKAA